MTTEDIGSFSYLDVKEKKKKKFKFKEPIIVFLAIVFLLWFIFGFLNFSITISNEYSNSYIPKKLDTKLLEIMLYDLTNEEREKHGIYQLSRNVDMDELALYYANYMAKYRRVSHTDLKGRNPLQRAQFLELPVQKEIIAETTKEKIYCEGIAEIITAYDIRLLRLKETDTNINFRIVNAIMGNWKQSKDGHYTLGVLGTNECDVGVAIVYKDKIIYAIENFRAGKRK